VSQLLNRRDERPFDADDERRFREFLKPIAVMLETWWHMTRLTRLSGQKPNGSLGT
jgi:hypothetical protein